MFHKSLSYTHILVWKSTLVRKVFFFYSRWWIQRHAIGQHAETKRLQCQAWHGRSVWHPSLEDSGTIGEETSERWWVWGSRGMLWTMFTGCDRAIAQMNLGTLHIQDVYKIKPVHPQHEWGRDYQSSTTPSWAVIGNWWLLGEVHLRGCPCFRRWSYIYALERITD